MRAALLVLALFALPVAFATNAGDPAGDVTATHYLGSPISVSASPYTECEHPGADIVGRTAQNSGGVFTAQLVVADRDAEPSCPLPHASTTDERYYVLRLDSPDATNVNLITATWRDMDGVITTTTEMQFSDGKSGTCSGSALLMVDDAFTVMCPTQGVAAMKNGSTRAYDLTGMRWDIQAKTGHVFGSRASFVQFDDIADWSRVTT